MTVVYDPGIPSRGGGPFGIESEHQVGKCISADVVREEPAGTSADLLLVLTGPQAGPSATVLKLALKSRRGCIFMQNMQLELE